MLRNNYRSRDLIGHYPFWVISPRNSTSFTRPFLAGRRARAGHETREKADIVDYTNDYLDRQGSNDLKAFLCSVSHTIGFQSIQKPIG